MHARESGSDDTSPRLALPHGRHLAVTWGIPDEYGGMTAAMLRRSRELVRRGRVDVDVVTFDERPDQADIERRLRADGAVIDGMRLRGIYAHARDADRAPVDVPRAVAPLDRPPDEEERGSDGSVRRWRDAGEVVRVEHARSDGTIAVVDERGPEARRITTFDARGRATGQWRSISAFRFAWLDELVGDEPAVAIVDSKTAARFMQRYRRPAVSLIHVVHGAHHDAVGRLAPARREVFEQLPRWDAVVFLTERQRADAAQLVGDTGNLAVVPNGVDVPQNAPRLPADRLHGMIVARLAGVKRLDHALRVIARVRELGVPVTADVVGDGAERERLESEAARLDLSGVVRFAGFVPNAARLLEGAAWTLLTSRSEGESLMLLEAMAAGCLPVAYDIRYGPSELIDDGRNGRLVPDGDVEAAARALVDLCGEDDETLAAMRRRARSAAERFDGDEIARRWAGVVRAAAQRHRQDPPVDAVALRRVRVRLRRGRLVISAWARGRPGARIRVRLVGPDREVVMASMRGRGPLRLARLSEDVSRRLGTGEMHIAFLIATGERTVGVDAGRRRPDPCPLVRRVLSRVRRGVSRSR